METERLTIHTQAVSAGTAGVLNAPNACNRPLKCSPLLFVCVAWPLGSLLHSPPPSPAVHVAIQRCGALQFVTHSLQLSPYLEATEGWGSVNAVAVHCSPSFISPLLVFLSNLCLLSTMSPAFFALQSLLPLRRLSGTSISYYQLTCCSSHNIRSKVG